MPDRVKGITIEIGGDTTGLSKALAGVNSDIRNTQSQLKDVNKLLRLDPTNINLLSQKQRLLNQAVEETRQKLQTVKEAEAQAQAQFAKGEISREQYEALQREVVDTEQALRQAETAAASFNARFEQISAVTAQASEKLRTASNNTKALSAAAAGVVTSLGAAAYGAITASDDLNTLAKQTGFTTAEIQKMQYASSLIDVEFSNVSSAATKMKRNMTSTSKDVQAAWDRLGVSVRNSNGELRNSTDVFWEVVAALSQVENETEKDTLAMTLFGKSADALAGIIDDGGKSLNELGSQAERLGLIMDQQTLDSLNSVNDEIDTLKANIKATLATNGAKAVEAFLPVAEHLIEVLGQGIQKVSELDTSTLKGIVTVGAAVAALSPALSAGSKILGIISSVSKVLPGFFALVAAHPFGAAAIGATALVAGIVALAQTSADAPDSIDTLTASAQNLSKAVEGASSVFSTNSAKIQENYGLAQALITRLYELEHQTERTGLEEYERNKIVEELNGIYPQLNLSIDKNTGLLNQNVDSLQQQIRALRDAAIQQALQEKYNTILSAMADAQMEVYENQLKLREATDRHSDATERAAALGEQLAEAQAKLAATSTSDAEAYNAAVAAVRELETEYGMASSEAEAWGYEVDQLNEAIKRGEAEVQKYADEYESAVTGITSLMNGAGESAGANYGEGLARGILSKKRRVAAAAEELARGVINQGNRTLEINSPAKSSERSGAYWDEGWIVGMEKRKAAVEAEAHEVAAIMAESASAATPTVNNTTNTNTSNLGGVYVTVNTAPGQDVESIADAVMDRIQEAVDREANAL